VAAGTGVVVDDSSDRVHMKLGPGIAVPRLRSKGWLELLVTLAAEVGIDGSPKAAKIEVDIEAGSSLADRCGLVRTRQEARQLVDELHAMAEVVDEWSDFSFAGFGCRTGHAAQQMPHNLRAPYIRWAKRPLSAWSIRSRNCAVCICIRVS